MEYLAAALGGIKVPKGDVLKLIAHLKSAVSSNLGFINFLLQMDQPSSIYADDATLLSLPVSLPGSSSPVLDMDPIKNKLPMVTFGDFQHGGRSKRGTSPAEREEDETCAICLNVMEESHEMRELPNCFHAFHANCLDSWVNQHHVTCPTCRSNLIVSQQ